MIDFRGEDHLEPGDRILCCIDGSATDPETGSVLYEQVEIARTLVSQNLQLLEDSRTLLLLVGDLYVQRHPPFKVTLPTRSPEVARLYADAMLAWANEPVSRPNASDCPQEEVQA